ncbi:conserved hypothetical protein [Trichinella spiralis]|uniref:hypothetical protein n=1 Tax=Trichinella spiralis TaxID=6334 RepID=UPI0001EFCDCC|nr:conserved hypothetical protein [Trichinella spiralis]
MRPIREKQVSNPRSLCHLSDFPLTGAVRDKSASERNSIKSNVEEQFQKTDNLIFHSIYQFSQAFGIEFHSEQNRSNTSELLAFSVEQHSKIPLFRIFKSQIPLCVECTSAFLLFVLYFGAGHNLSSPKSCNTLKTGF